MSSKYTQNLLWALAGLFLAGVVLGTAVLFEDRRAKPPSLTDPDYFAGVEPHYRDLVILEPSTDGTLSFSLKDDPVLRPVIVNTLDRTISYNSCTSFFVEHQGKQGWTRFSVPVMCVEDLSTTVFVPIRPGARLPLRVVYLNEELPRTNTIGRWYRLRYMLRQEGKDDLETVTVPFEVTK